VSKALLTLIVLAFVLLVGGGVAKRTHLAVAPPIYDPMGYYYKSEVVWSALAKGDLHGVLNGPMAPRPPGTSLILYPFGFKVSIRSFLFRSVFVPVLIWVIALSIPILTVVSRRSDALVGSALVVGLATMPLFYHFELSNTFTNIYHISNQWGLVDSLEGAIAALAISLLCLGIVKRSLLWCTLSWFVGAFSLFIKPSGMLVMMTLVGVATVEFAVRFFGCRYHRSVILKFAAFAYLIGFSIFGFALWLALSSDYMTREVIAQAVKASQFVLDMNQGTSLLSMLSWFVGPVIGWWWFCPGVLLVCLLLFESVRSVVKRQWTATGSRLVAAALILLSAFYWWIRLAGQQHRYLFPFLLIVIVWFVPEIFQRIRQFGPAAKRVAIGYCFAPAVLLLSLLWAKHPPIMLQELMGINLSAGGYGSEAKQGQWLFAESERLGRPLNLYSLGVYGVGAVEMIDWEKSVENKSTPGRFFVRRPLNWVDTPGLRADDLLHSDFFLLEDIRPGKVDQATPVSYWPEEVERFKQFAFSDRGIDKNGLELVSDGTVKVLRVADASKFGKALYAWANSISWTDGFRERNKIFLENPPQ
jgi:hypothetical protein